MRNVFLICSFSILSLLAAGCVSIALKSTREEYKTAAPNTVTTFDEAYANKLGADNYGMKNYVLAFLKKGPNRYQDSASSAKIQSAHLKNIQRLANAGKLILAGPFLDDGDLRGIFIFNVETLEEAKQLAETDPAVQAGRLSMELHPWYGSAALQEVTPLHRKLEKKNIFE